MDKLSNGKNLEDSVKSCYSTWGKRYYQDFYKSPLAYPPVHTDIVRSLLKPSRINNLLDAGCGPASMLRDLDSLNIERYGFDLTPEMVTEAQQVLNSQGVPKERIWQGSVLDIQSFRSSPDGMQKYDACICFGVFPHIPEEFDQIVLSNLISSVNSGGLVLIEARNELFSLFSLNRYSNHFFKDRLIDQDHIRTLAGEDLDELNSALSSLDDSFLMDLPPLRKGYENEPGYDEVLSRVHNPLLLKETASKLGLLDVKLLFYHYHALPPYLEPHIPSLYRKLSLGMENPYDWRGHFMASAFILLGVVP